jgi:hypothetical protein
MLGRKAVGISYVITSPLGQKYTTTPTELHCIRRIYLKMS